MKRGLLLVFTFIENPFVVELAYQEFCKFLRHSKRCTNIERTNKKTLNTNSYCPNVRIASLRLCTPSFLNIFIASCLTVDSL